MNFISSGAVTKRPGTSLYLGATVSGSVGGMFEFEKLNGNSYIIGTANTNAYTITNSWNSFKSGLKNNGIFSFVPFVDRLFMANGQDFFKFDGSASTNYSLPPGVSTSSFGITGIYNASGGLTGTVVAGYGYVNDAGYAGPVSNGITVSLNGISYNALLYSGLTTPAGYGISSIYLYRSAASSVNMFGTTQIPISGATFVDYSPLTNDAAPPFIQFTMAPQYLELYNNQLMMAGFSAFPSTLYWSDVGEPEGVQPQSFAEFRTDDSDVIRGIRAYQGNLIIAKERSFHILSGQVPETFSIQQITDQYGCLSHRTMVVFNSTLFFLDPKGVVQYNGANPEIISTRVEDVFARMNIRAARNVACAIHNRQYNQVEFYIPVDGATQNNMVVVYDYIVDAWTTYSGLNVSSIVVGQGSLLSRTPIWGGYSGTISFFDAGIYGDNGQAITCTIQSRFLSLYGQSVEQQFRRFFVNLAPISGSSQAINVNFRSNFGTSNVMGFTIGQAPFQTRIDFGIPAKTLSAQIIHSSATMPLTVFGWTVESRFQRPV